MFDNDVIKILLIFFPGIVGVILINYAINTYKSFELYLGLLYSFHSLKWMEIFLKWIFQKKVYF